MPDRTRPILLFDGVCGLCNRLVQFLLERDVHDRLRFASLQSELAASLLMRHDLDANDLDTVYLVVDHGQPAERVLARSEAILYALAQLGGIWKMAAIGKLLPKGVRDLFYNLVARNRYRIFGKYDACMLPEERHRKRFLDT